jgi:TonB family protein
MSASAPSPRPFGPYVLTRAIGTDALGEVWRGGTAGRPRLQPLLLFRLFTSAAVDRTALFAAMETAVHLVDEVKGPAVARGTVLGAIDDVPFLAVEYVEGRTLDSLFAARVLGAAIPVEHGLLIAERLLTALEAGAPVERFTGAPHGFLVPAFVSVSNEGEARVFGYGLGTGLLPSLGVPRARQALAPYFAPEVLASGKPGTSGDLYGVGAILFEALTGKPPIPGVALESIDGAALAVDGAPVPEDIRRLLRRALHPDPATRDRNVAGYRRDLSALLYGGPYAPSTFNLAFFLQKNFERAIQREKAEITAEEELDPSLVAAAREARTAAESTGRRRVESSGGARKPDATGPARKVESTTGSRRTPVIPPPPVRPPPARGAASLRMVSGPPKKKPLGGVPVWAVALGGAAVLGAGAFLALKPAAQAPALAPTPAPRPTAAPPAPVPTPAPVVVGKEDPLFQAAVQKKLDEELKKQEARAARQQDVVAKKKQADIDKAAEDARKARETDDTARAASDKSDREEAGRLAREAAAKRRELAQAAAAPAPAPAVKEGDLIDVDACDTPPVSTRQVSPVVPPMARQRRIAGTVLLRVLVDEQGNPEKVEVIRDVTPNVGLGTASRQALERWRWKPATKDGVKVKTWLVVQVPFKN